MRRRITDAEVAKRLGATRKTANERLNGELSADHVIAISRGLV